MLSTLAVLFLAIITIGIAIPIMINFIFDLLEQAEKEHRERKAQAEKKRKVEVVSRGGFYTHNGKVYISNETSKQEVEID